LSERISFFSYTQNDTLHKKLPQGANLIYSTFKIPINTKSIAGYVASTGCALNITDVYDLEATSPYRFSKQFDSRYDMLRAIQKRYREDAEHF
jgi:hypothetical protein